MAKELKDWIDEFVEQGANPKNVTNWPEEATGRGGSVIVDALPAQGKEGTTYLLRKKNESKVFKAQCYAPLYSKAGDLLDALVMIDADIELLFKEITTKLNPDLGNGLVDFSPLESFEQSNMSSEEWNTFTTSNKVAIVKTEEDVLKITEDVDYIYQDLGKIGVENFIFLEVREAYISSGTTYDSVNLFEFSNDYCMCLEKQGDKVVSKTRGVVYNSEATSGQSKYSFGEWEVLMEGQLKDTLTDTYIYNQETLMSLEDGDCYLINLTPIPQEVSYSYTQYVFDQGVYTPLGGGARYFVTVYGNTNMAGNYPGQVTIEVDTPNINTVDDLFDWLKAKGFVTTVEPGSPLSPTAVYPNAIGMDTNESRLVAGCVLYDNGEGNRSIYFPKADIAIYGYRSDGYTLTYVNPEK